MQKPNFKQFVPNKSAAFNAGWESFFIDRDQTDNPHAAGSEQSKNWAEGFAEAQAGSEAFAGLNDSYKEMDAELSKVAPRCHFRPMSLESGDGENSVNTWWECSVCGHTKGNFLI